MKRLLCNFNLLAAAETTNKQIMSFRATKPFLSSGASIASQKLTLKPQLSPYFTPTRSFITSWPQKLDPTHKIDQKQSRAPKPPKRSYPARGPSLIKVPYHFPSDTKSENENSFEDDDEGINKSNTSKLGSIDLEEIDAMVDKDVIAAIDRVLSEGTTLSLKSQHPDSPEKLLQELRDIAFKEDLIEKFKKGLTPQVNFSEVMEKIDANTDAFSYYQLKQVDVVVNLLNNIVRMFAKLENLKKEQDSAKKNSDQNNEALKETRRRILTSKTSLTNYQTQRKSLDSQIADLRAKLGKLQVEWDYVAEGQDHENCKITSLKKEVKSIFHRLADDQIKLKSVEDQIPEAQTELESHEKIYRNFRAVPLF